MICGFMSLYKKYHRMLLVLGFVYLTMCPNADVIGNYFNDHTMLGNRIGSFDQRGHREYHQNIPHAAAQIPAQNLFETIGSSSRLYFDSLSPQDIHLTPLSCVKLQL